MNVAGKDAGRVFWTEGGDRVFGLTWEQIKTLVVDDPPTDPGLSAEALADKAAGFHPMAKPVKAVKEHPGPQKHDAGAVPMKALRIGWDR